MLAFQAPSQVDLTLHIYIYNIYIYTYTYIPIHIHVPNSSNKLRFHSLLSMVVFFLCPSTLRLACRETHFFVTSHILLMVQKSGHHQLRLVVYPITYRVLAPSQVVVWDFWTFNSSKYNIGYSWSIICPLKENASDTYYLKVLHM